MVERKADTPAYRNWAFIGAYLALCGVAEAHSWYSFGCCNDRDCIEVPGPVILEEDGYRLPTGEVIKRSDTRIQESQDFNFHWCLTQTGSIRCLYVPKGGGT